MTHPGQPQWNTAGHRTPAAVAPQQWPPYQEQTTVLARPPAGGGSPLRTKIIVGLAVAALGLAGVAAWAGLTATSANAAEVQLEPVSYAGASPFLAPVGQDKVGVTPPAGTGGEFTGNTPGLYAETDMPSCDTQSLVSGLQADTVKSAAWAKATGIEPAGIPKFVNSLTPVVLRSDTAVTNYGFRAGTFAPSQSVLQAGSAVLINSYGEPTVKCFSGNPLAKPASYDVQEVAYAGPQWTSFEPTRCTFIEPTTVVIKKHVFIDYEDQTPHEKDGKPDTKENPGPNPDHQPDPKADPKPDPAKEMAAMEAKKLAETSAKDATDKRATADDKAVEARIFDTEARNLETQAKTAQDAVVAAQAKLDATSNTDIGALAAAQGALIQAQINAGLAGKAAMDARSMATDKANQAKFSDAAARDAEAVSKIAEEAAEKTEAAANGQPGGTGTTPADKKTLTADGTDGQTTEQATGQTDGTTTDGTGTGTGTDGTTNGQATDPTTGDTADGTTVLPGTTENGTAELPGTNPPAGTDPATGGNPPAGTEVPAGTGPTGPVSSPFMQDVPPAGNGPAGPPAGAGPPDANTGIAGGDAGAGQGAQPGGGQQGGVNG